MPSRPSAPSTLFALALAALVLSGCAGGAPSHDEASAPTDAHGARADAVEAAEPQLALTMVTASGAVTQLDLLDESVRTVGTVGAPASTHTDGRYLFVGTGTGVDVVDSGVWTWDHVDHFHYYRAEPRILGTVSGTGAATVATTTQSTSGSTGIFFADSGEAVLVDTEALSRGEVVEHFRRTGTPHAGLVVPVGAFALVTEAADTAGTDHGEADRVVVYTEDGRATGRAEPCRQARGTITTRVGAVIGCADGALLATADDAGPTIQRIPYPADVSAPAATAFANREGRPVVAALAGTDAVWLLDTRARAWTLLPAPAPLAAATAVDDQNDHVLALARDGRLFVLDGANGGAVLAETEPLLAAPLGEADPAPVLTVDQHRAYLGGGGQSRVLEIDFADGARIARTFEQAQPLGGFAETGL